MKILLTSLNAKYIHTSLALRTLCANANAFRDDCVMLEFTINQSCEYILQEIASVEPDIVCFSCYIWNIEMTLRIISDLKKIKPGIKIILGGPEVSFEPETVLDSNSGLIDYIVCGEGEEIFEHLLERIHKSIPTEPIVYAHYAERDKRQIAGYVTDINALKFDYPGDLSHKIVYFESSRGCPFNCQFCLSAGDGLRFLDVQTVYERIDYFIARGVKQVKFIDRTFNCDAGRAAAIWTYIMSKDTSVNFHFEIEASIISDVELELLKKARPGLLQFEIGVQSTNAETLSAIERYSDFDKVKYAVEQIRGFDNIHLHLDLIIGLPFENYESFKKSFNDVYSLKPHQLQLGFLKILKGSGIKNKAEEYGITFSQFPPYEVLETNCLSYVELRKLKIVEDMVERYYNSGKALNILRYLTASPSFSSPFDVYEQLAEYWVLNKYDSINVGKMDLYNVLYYFCSIKLPHKIDICASMLKLDILLNDNIKTLPSWADYGRNEVDKIKRSGALPKLNRKISCVSAFKYDVFALSGGATEDECLHGIIMEFDYTCRDIFYGHAKAKKIDDYFPL